MNSEIKTCQNCKQNFPIEDEDLAFYRKMEVPPPTFCSPCRFQRRIAYRNERKIFRNKSALSGKPILALYSLASGATVFDEDEWRSDEWDPMAYGREYDFSRTFFAQFRELALAVPRLPRSVESNINCDYTANIGYSKNCYLVFNTVHAEDSAYANAILSSKECFDGSHAKKCERCYELLWNESCYRTHFSTLCKDCSDVWFSKNCTGCSDCLGCVNLRKQNHCIFNEQYSKEEYMKRVADYRLDTWTGIVKFKKQAMEFWNSFPVKYIQGINNLNVTGEYVKNSKNIHKGYLIDDSENVRYSQYLLEPSTKDSMDVSIWGGGIEMCYECTICGFGIFSSRFCLECWPDIKDCDYCMFCRSSSDLFGCSGLKNKQYCILNRQYSKEEYFDLREKIIAQMNNKPFVDARGSVYRYGEYFPTEHSAIGYNASLASEHFPLNKEDAAICGYPWQESEQREYVTDLTVEDIPDSINDVEDAILQKLIACSECKKAYRVIKDEFAFLKKEGIPIPRSCQDCRHKTRISRRNKSRLYTRSCACDGAESSDKKYRNTAPHQHGSQKCGVQFETSYSPERSEIVYCEGCYNAEVA